MQFYSVELQTGDLCILGSLYRSDKQDCLILRVKLFLNTAELEAGNRALKRLLVIGIFAQ
jgi:hypothetical protein